MFQTLFGVNMSIFMGAMAPGSEVTFFLAATSVSTLSVTIQSKKFSISVIALFNYHISNIFIVYLNSWIILVVSKYQIFTFTSIEHNTAEIMISSGELNKWLGFQYHIYLMDRTPNVV